MFKENLLSHIVSLCWWSWMPLSTATPCSGLLHYTNRTSLSSSFYCPDFPQSLIALPWPPSIPHCTSLTFLNPSLYCPDLPQSLIVLPWPPSIPHCTALASLNPSLYWPCLPPPLIPLLLFHYCQTYGGAAGQILPGRGFCGRVISHGVAGDVLRTPLSLINWVSEAVILLSKYLQIFLSKYLQIPNNHKS